MADRDDTAKLLKEIERILEENDLEAFVECWNLGRELMEGLPVRAFYACSEDSLVQPNGRQILDVGNNPMVQERFKTVESALAA